MFPQQVSGEWDEAVAGSVFSLVLMTIVPHGAWLRFSGRMHGRKQVGGIRRVQRRC